MCEQLHIHTHVHGSATRRECVNLEKNIYMLIANPEPQECVTGQQDKLERLFIAIFQN